MFPGAIIPALFARHPHTDYIGCPDCGSDWEKHNLHMLEEKRQVNVRLGNAVRTLLNVYPGISGNGLAKDEIADALISFLNFAIDQEIKQLHAPRQPAPPMYTPEDLIRASASLQKLEEQKRQLEEQLGHAPDEVREAMGFAGVMFMQIVDGQIESAQALVSHIQEELEKPSEPA
jgi:hypothetical protein